MPYVIRQDGPVDKPFCVYKESGGETLGCHANPREAERHMTAILVSTHSEQKAIGRRGRWVPSAYLNDLCDGCGDAALAKGFKAVDLDTLPVGRESEQPLRLALIITSNAYEDRDKEIIRQKALEDWVGAAWKDNAFIAANPLLFWHCGDPIGDIVYADTEGPFLIEVAQERPDSMVNLMPPGGPPVMASIKGVWDAFEGLPVEWGASHEFLFLKEDSQDGVYERIVKTESSVLPRQAAANMYTLFSVIKEKQDG